mmetsp:Transcript_42330/g.106698  ORF Transcript_42330/g.106698 Transcript_42330/m.106698 type:complete len:559 (-) Transcript_42330:88-1764(-)
MIKDVRDVITWIVVFFTVTTTVGVMCHQLFASCWWTFNLMITLMIWGGKQGHQCEDQCWWVNFFPHWHTFSWLSRLFTRLMPKLSMNRLLGYWLLLSFVEWTVRNSFLLDNLCKTIAFIFVANDGMIDIFTADKYDNRDSCTLVKCPSLVPGAAEIIRQKISVPANAEPYPIESASMDIRAYQHFTIQGLNKKETAYGALSVAAFAIRLAMEVLEKDVFLKYKRVQSYLKNRYIFFSDNPDLVEMIARLKDAHSWEGHNRDMQGAGMRQIIRKRLSITLTQITTRMTSLGWWADSPPDWQAYVYHDESQEHFIEPRIGGYKIYMCKGFWDLVDKKGENWYKVELGCPAGIMIHELSHLIFGTNDDLYGTDQVDNCKNDFVKHKNADNFRFLVEEIAQFFLCPDQKAIRDEAIVKAGKDFLPEFTMGGFWDEFTVSWTGFHINRDTYEIFVDERDSKIILGGHNTMSSSCNVSTQETNGVMEVTVQVDGFVVKYTVISHNLLVGRWEDLDQKASKTKKPKAGYALMVRQKNETLLGERYGLLQEVKSGQSGPSSPLLNA